jgi:HSP20 family molecular chaperone IbpA
VPRGAASFRFDRSFTLPIGINAERIVAEYLDGVLALFVPCAESQKTRTIKSDNLKQAGDNNGYPTRTAG